MQQPTANNQREVADQIARSLLEQGERCAEAGMLAQAGALLMQAWGMASEHNQPLADSTAWALGWVYLRQGSYGEARDWFQRIKQAPAQSCRSWEFVARSLEQICGLAPREHGLSLTRLSAPTPIHVVSLGSFQVLRGGIKLPACRSRRAITILRCLLASPYRAATREELMDMLWPEARPRQAAHNLHVAISALRDYLDDGPHSAVLYEGGSYRLSPAVPISDDSAEFVALCHEGDRQAAGNNLPAAQRAYERAVALYRGDYAVDAGGPPALLAERERLLNRFLLTLERIGRMEVSLDHHEHAVAHFQRLLERDPYREDIFGLLLSSYLQLGRRAEALRHYERFCGLLSRELGLGAPPELYQLVEQIWQPALVARAAPE